MTSLLGWVRDLGFAALGLALLAAPFVLTVKAQGAETISGPVGATVTEVIDGDTFWVKARIWIGHEVTTKVRLSGIDAPEIGSHAKCAAEKQKGEDARAYLTGLVGGQSVQLTDIRADKYGGRVDARVAVEGGAGKFIDLGELLVTKGFAVAYGRAKPWCAP
jgi:endonuclease YncB( thermonuclease family)